MTQYTENYQLELYEGTDKADLTDQYNVSMRLVDEALKGVDTGTKAEISRLEGDLATTNSNLNATNQNAAALKKEVEDNYAQQLATDAQQQTEIDALSRKVTNNTTLVEEHVNYFADLGVTDEQSAHDLHNQIDQSFQGVMSNTLAIAGLQETVSDVRLSTDIAATLKKYNRSPNLGGTISVRPSLSGSTYNYTLESDSVVSFKNGIAIIAPNEDGSTIVSCRGNAEILLFADLPFNVTSGQLFEIFFTPTNEYKSTYTMFELNKARLKVSDTLNITYPATGAAPWNALFHAPNNDSYLGVTSIEAYVVYTFVVTKPKPHDWDGEYAGNLIGDDQYEIACEPPQRFTGSINPVTKTFTVNAWGGLEPAAGYWKLQSRTPTGVEVTIVGETIPGVQGTAWKIFSDADLPTARKTLSGSITLRASNSPFDPIWASEKAISASLVVYNQTIYAVFSDDVVGTISTLGSLNAGSGVHVSLSINATNVHYE